MASSFVESALVGACPSLAAEWAAHRRAYPPGAAPSEDELFAVLRTHVQWLLAGGRVAEVTRLCYAIERLLDGADPILESLLVERLVVPLAGDVHAAGGDERLVLPHLGPRLRAAWMRAIA